MIEHLLHPMADRNNVENTTSSTQTPYCYQRWAVTLLATVMIKVIKHLYPVGYNSPAGTILSGWVSGQFDVGDTAYSQEIVLQRAL